MVIRTRSIREARPGDLATYRWGSLRQFENGRFFAPSEGLLSDYKHGGVSWEAYEKRYLKEMEDLYCKFPERFLELLEREEVTLLCYEAKPDKCHRRLLAEFLARKGEERRILVKLDIQ